MTAPIQQPCALCHAPRAAHNDAVCSFGWTPPSTPPPPDAIIKRTALSNALLTAGGLTVRAFAAEALAIEEHRRRDTDATLEALRRAIDASREARLAEHLAREAMEAFEL